MSIDVAASYFRIQRISIPTSSRYIGLADCTRASTKSIRMGVAQTCTVFFVCVAYLSLFMLFIPCAVHIAHIIVCEHSGLFQRAYATERSSVVGINKHPSVVRNVRFLS